MSQNVLPVSGRILFERQPHKPCHESIVSGKPPGRVKVVHSLWEITFSPHLIDVGFAFACFTEGCRVRTIVDDVIELVKESPTHVESLKGGLVSDHLIKISEIDLYYEDGRTARDVLFHCWNYTAERYVGRLLASSITTHCG